MNLEHCRWGPHLKEISNTFKEKVIFWKGELGGHIKPNWKDYRYSQHLDRYISIINKFQKLQYVYGKSTLAQRYFYRCAWYFAAMMQGAHMSFLRQLTNSLVLSGYHGPAVRKVFSQVDLHSSVQEDVRPLIGRYLHGCPVLYPSINPGPPLSKIRKGISHVEPFLKALTSLGVTINNK